MYLMAIIDLYSQFIVGSELSNSLEAEGCLRVFGQAVTHFETPEIINSDQRSQFTDEKRVVAVRKTAARLSMDEKERALDNIFIEQFWKTVKYDYMYLSPTSECITLYKGVKRFISSDNIESHQSIKRESRSCYSCRVDQNLSRIIQRFKMPVNGERVYIAYRRRSTGYPCTISRRFKGRYLLTLQIRGPNFGE